MTNPGSGEHLSPYQDVRIRTYKSIYDVHYQDNIIIPLHPGPP